ncbi:hypothetical protein P3G55_07775 [Leptospira sp. 96542]|nr:hypothetical protein [Leptospira sp. 96542]
MKLSYNKSFKLVFCALFIICFLGCHHNWGNFKRYSVDSPNNLEIKGEQVSGKDCRFLFSFTDSYLLLPTNWYWNSIAEASRNALRSNTSATGLKDVEIESQFYLLFNCISVTGIPVVEK